MKHRNLSILVIGILVIGVVWVLNEGCDVRINETEQVRIKLGWSIANVQERSMIEKQLTESVMDHQLYVLTNPIRVLYEIDESKAITFPAGRYLYIVTDALHVTGVRVSPQINGLDINSAFNLAREIEVLLQSAGLEETFVKRTSRTEAELYLSNLKRGFPIRVRLFQYALDQTNFRLEVARINADDYVVTVRISNREISRYWMAAAEYLAEYDHNNQSIAREVDLEAYLEKLTKLPWRQP